MLKRYPLWLIAGHKTASIEELEETRLRLQKKLERAVTGHRLPSCGDTYFCFRREGSEEPPLKKAEKHCVFWGKVQAYPAIYDQDAA
jgi:hypothetical protein